MRKHFKFLPAVLSVLIVDGAAQAEPMVWRGELSLNVSGLPETVVFEGMGVAEVNEGIRLETIAFDGGITGTATIPVTDPEVTVDGLISIRVTATLGSGTLRQDWSAAATEPLLSERTLPVRGLVRLCLFFSDCSSYLSIPLSAQTLSGTLGVGIGGLLTAGGSGLIRISVQAAPWTLGTASVTGVTPTSSQTFQLPEFGWVHGPLSFTGSTLFVSSGGQRGALQLVTPIMVHSNTGINMFGFGELRVQLVPEAGSLLMLFSGVAGLVMIGRSRMKP